MLPMKHSTDNTIQLFVVAIASVIINAFGTFQTLNIISYEWMSFFISFLSSPSECHSIFKFAHSYKFHANRKRIEPYLTCSKPNIHSPRNRKCRTLTEAKLKVQVKTNFVEIQERKEFRKRNVSIPFAKLLSEKWWKKVPCSKWDIFSKFRHKIGIPSFDYRCSFRTENVSNLRGKNANDEKMMKYEPNQLAVWYWKSNWTQGYELWIYEKIFLSKKDRRLKYCRYIPW